MPLYDPSNVMDVIVVSISYDLGGGRAPPGPKRWSRELIITISTHALVSRTEHKSVVKDVTASGHCDQDSPLVIQ